MKTFLFSDLHLKEDNLQECKEIIDQGIEKSEELKVREWIFLGDMFVNRSAQKLAVLLCFSEILKKLEDHKIKLYAIPGNHDKTDLESELNYLGLFKNSNFLLSSEEDVYLNDNGTKWYFLPYFKENGSLIGRLNVLQEEASNGERGKYLFLHSAVNGIKNNDGTLVKDGLQQGLFSSFSKVFVGHYHNYCKLTNKITYIGSVKPHNYGEDNDKGFWLFDDKDGEITRIPINFKKYIKVVLDLDVRNKIFIETMRKKFANSTNNIRFIFQGTEDQLAMIDKNMFEDVGIEVKKENKNVVRSLQLLEEVGTIRFDNKSIMKNFIQYCAINKVQSEQRQIAMNYFKML